MELTASIRTPFEMATVYDVVADLTTYARWLEIVDSVEPIDGGWSVVLTAQLGPLRRSKRLRMISAPETSAHDVGFVREERDGRDHSEWRLTARVTPDDGGSELAMTLHYGGSLWAAPLDGVLRREIAASRPRLLTVLEETAQADR